MVWKTLPQSPGFQGKKRNATIGELNNKYGEGKWRFAWVVWNIGKNHHLPFEQAITLYEDAYFVFICMGKIKTGEGCDEVTLRTFDARNTPEMAVDIAQYKECYDNDPSNVNSGVDYSKQETKSNHYQDISVRRVMARLGLSFIGRKDELLHIRGSSHQPLGARLSPGNVPFHIPHLIKKPELSGWWHAGTVESFWQSNKVIQVIE